MPVLTTCQDFILAQPECILRPLAIARTASCGLEVDFVGVTMPEVDSVGVDLVGVNFVRVR